VNGLTSFNKLGSGKLTISSTSGTLAPTVSILGGTLELGNGDNQIPVGGFLNGLTALYLDAIGGSPELSANGVKVDLNANVTLSNSGAVISGSKGSSAYSFNFKKDIIISDNSTATLSATSMVIGSSSKINVGNNSTLTVSGSLIDNTEIPQATQITKEGAGTLELTGTGNTYSGATTVNAGNLNISAGALTNSSTAITVNSSGNLTATDLGANVSVTVNSGGTADISGTDISVKDITSQTTSTTAFGFSGTSGKVTAQSISGTGAIAFGSDLEVSALNGSGTIILTAATPTLTVSSGQFYGTLAGAATLIKKGSGTLDLMGNNNLSGAVVLQNGTLNVGNLNALGTSADSPENLIFQGGNLKYSGGVSTTMTRDFTVGNGGAGFFSSGKWAWVIGPDAQMDFTDGAAANRTLSLGGVSYISSENIFNPTKFDPNDIANLFTKLVKQDSNKWIVLGAGAGFVDDAQTEIDVQNGELGFAMGSLGSKSTITVGSITPGATSTLGWVSGNTEDVSGRVNLRASSNAAFDIPSGTTVTFASALNGGVTNNASVTKIGDGTLNLSVSNPFTGGFSISGGIVKAGVTGALGSGNVTVNANSTLIVNAVLANTITIKSGGTVSSESS
jgi:autotransporter-associated beta strand protein